MKLYKDILAAAWQHTIHQPSLWLFGLFAAFIFGNAGELDRYLRFMNGIVAEGDMINPRFWLDHRWANFVSSMLLSLQESKTSAFILLAAMAGAFILVVIMVCVSAGALMASAGTPRTSFTEAFRAGAQHWGALFTVFLGGYGLVVLTTVIVGGLIFKLDIPVETAQQTFTLVGSILFIPLVVVTSFIVRFTAQGIVLQNLHIIPALRQACVMLRRSWLVVLEMAIVNFLVIMLINLLLVVVVGLLFAPQYATAVGLVTSTSLDRLYSTVVVSGLVYVVLVVLVGAILSTWQWTVWTLLFKRLRTEQPDSTLLRWLGHRPKKV